MAHKLELPRYCCTRCRERWVVAPGPTACPRCGELYVIWQNYPAPTGRSLDELRRIFAVSTPLAPIQPKALDDAA